MRSRLGLNLAALTPRPTRLSSTAINLASHRPTSVAPPSTNSTPHRSLSTTSAKMTAPVNAAKPNEKYGWAISDKVTTELTKQDVWSVFSPASGHVPSDSLNLGQGFMSWGPPDFIQKAAKDVIEKVDVNHYPIPRGRQRLRNALSEYLSPSFKLDGGRKLDPNTEILVSAGANGGMYSFATAWLRPGDEVIVIEPFFDQYIAQIKFNGGVPVYVPLRAPAAASTGVVSANEWKVDPEELRKAITPKTKQIWINTPHNPSGKVFDEQELRMIGNLAEEFDLQILSDEVYDCLTFEGTPHVRIASLDDFWKRTVTVGSAGKSFSATGWRLGWLVGPQHLIQPTMAAQTRITFCVNGPAQEASAIGLELSLTNGFFEQQVKEYEERKAALIAKLDVLGLPYTIPHGAYFVLVNTDRLEIPDEFESLDLIKNRTRDWRAAWFVAKTAGVVVIPPSDFYSEEHAHLAESWIRFAFCKDVKTLEDAGDRLLKLKPYIRDA